MIAKTLILLGASLIFKRGPVYKDLPVYERMTSAAVDAEEALRRHPWPEAVQEKRARIVFTTGFFEGGLYASPPGWNDNGHACGVMQTHMPWIEIPGTTCASVRKSRILGFEIGILRLQALEKKCGSIAKALTAYAGNGTCRSHVPFFVKQRCTLAGLSPLCE